MSVFTTAHCLPPHRLHSPPRPISPTTALEHISKYLADTETSPHLHPDCRFNEHGPTLEGRPPGGGLTLHQLGRVVRGLKGERLGEERVVVDADGLESAVEVEAEVGGEGARAGVSDDTVLDLAVEKTASKLRDAAGKLSNGVPVTMPAQAPDVDMADDDDEEELVEKSYNQQMLEQGERGNVQEMLDEGHPKVIENVSVPEIEATGGAKEEDAGKKSKKRKRESAGRKDGGAGNEATQKVVQERPEGEAKETDGKGGEARSSKKARKEARRLQKAQDAGKTTAKPDDDMGDQSPSKQAPPDQIEKGNEAVVKAVPPTNTTTGTEANDTISGETAPPSDKRARKKARREAKMAREQELISLPNEPEPVSQASESVPQLAANGKRDKKKNKSKGKHDVSEGSKESVTAGSLGPVVAKSKSSGKILTDQTNDATLGAEQDNDDSQKALKNKSHSSANIIPDAGTAEEKSHKPSEEKSNKSAKDKSTKPAKDKSTKSPDEDNEKTNPPKADEAVKERKKSKKHDKHSEKHQDSKKASPPKLTSKTSADVSTSSLPHAPSTSKATKAASPPSGDHKNKHKASTSERRAAHRKRQRDASNDAASPSVIEQEQPSKKKAKHESKEHEQKAIDVAREKHVTADDKPAKKEKKKDKKKSKSSESGKGDKASDAALPTVNGNAKPEKAASPPKKSQQLVNGDSEKKHKKKPATTSESNTKAPITQSGPNKKRKSDEAGNEGSKSEAKKARNEKKHSKEERAKFKANYTNSERKQHHQSIQERMAALKESDKLAAAKSG